jgi:hypothetical protein
MRSSNPFCEKGNLQFSFPLVRYKNEWFLFRVACLFFIKNLGEHCRAQQGTGDSSLGSVFRVPGFRNAHCN